MNESPQRRPRDSCHFHQYHMLEVGCIQKNVSIGLGLDGISMGCVMNINGILIGCIPLRLDGFEIQLIFIKHVNPILYDMNLADIWHSCDTFGPVMIPLASTFLVHPRGNVEL